MTKVFAKPVTAIVVGRGIVAEFTQAMRRSIRMSSELSASSIRIPSVNS